MRLFDLHCDTLYKTYTENKSLISNDCCISFERGKAFDKWIQCMAVWIPDEVRGEAAVNLVENCCEFLQNELKNNNGSVKQIDTLSDIVGKANVILTLEGGACLGGKIENVQRFRNMGARIMTLTWNGSCELGDGAEAKHSKGLSDFGKEVVKEMERCGIVVDVSHASDRLFYDVVQIAQRPIIATHSNSRSICPHKRNLTDEQFNIIAKSGGIVGLNFHKYFLSDNNWSVSDIIKHAEYFLSLGGENSIAIGSDFDGAEMPDDIVSMEDLHKIFNAFGKLNYSDTLIDKLFFKNAYNFFQSFDN